MIFPQINSYHDINKNIHKFIIEHMEYAYVELAGSHTYFLKLKLDRPLVLPSALDLARLGVLPWFVDLAPVGKTDAGPPTGPPLSA